MQTKSRSAALRLKSRKGGMYVDVIIGLGIMITIGAMLITLYPVFSTSQHLDETARAIARVIEVSGREGPEINELLDRDTILIPDTITVKAERYFDATEKKIQYKDPFEVTITKEIPLIVIQPLFSNEPLVYNITLRRSIVGVSEVYWK